MNENQKIMCIVLILLSVAVGLYLVIPNAQKSFETYKAIQEKTQKAESTKQQIADLKTKNEAYEKEEKTATKPVYKSDLATLDQMASFGIMFEDVIQSAKYNGLRLRSISYNTNPAADVIKSNIGDAYNVCEVKMQLIGNYLQFRSYFQDIYNYPYLINLDKISIFPYASNPKILIADVSVMLYSEMNDAQKAAAKALRDAETQGDEAVEGGAGSELAPAQ